jgi:Right handed beta helix region
LHSSGRGRLFNAGARTGHPNLGVRRGGRRKSVQPHGTCKTFAGAISQTAAGGEINVLDPGGFGAVTITKAISMISENIEAGVLVSGTNGIVVSVSSTDQVVLNGLDIEGLGTGLDGIKVIGSGTTFIRNCKIRHFTGNGVNVVGTANARVVVENSQILYNAGGLNVQGAGGVANAATIAHSIVDSNSSFAVQANGASNADRAHGELSHGKSGWHQRFEWGGGRFFRRKQSYRGKWRSDANYAAKVDDALTCELAGQIVACTKLPSTY